MIEDERRPEQHADEQDRYAEDQGTDVSTDAWSRRPRPVTTVTRPRRRTRPTASLATSGATT